MLVLAICLRQSSKIHGFLKNRTKILNTGGSVQKYRKVMTIKITHKFKLEVGVFPAGSGDRQTRISWGLRGDLGKSVGMESPR